MFVKPLAVDLVPDNGGASPESSGSLWRQSAQAQFYFNVFTGYSFSTNPQKTENVEVRDNAVDSHYTKFYYGKGMNLGVGIGYNFKNGLGVALSSNTQIFTRSAYKNHWRSPSNYEGNYYVSGLRGEGGKENKSIQLAPLLVYTLDMGRIAPYLKVGLNFLKVKTVSDQVYKGKYPDFTTEHLYEIQSTLSGKWRTGFRGAIGATYKISDKWNIYAEFFDGEYELSI